MTAPQQAEEVIDLVPDDDEVIDLVSPIRAAAGVFRVTRSGTAQRIPIRADEYGGPRRHD